MAAGELIVIDVETSSSGMPSNRSSMSSSESRATPSGRPRRANAGDPSRAHERRHIERRRKPGLAVLEQVAEARVRLLGRAESGELAHRPEPAPVHRLVHAAGEGVRAGIAEVAVVVDRGALGAVDRIDVDAADRRRYGRRCRRLGIRPGRRHRVRRVGRFPDSMISDNRMTVSLSLLQPGYPEMRDRGTCRGDALRRPDRGGTAPVALALGRGARPLDDGGHVDHAGPPNPDGAPEHAAEALRPDVPALRGADAPLLQPPRFAPAREDRRQAAGRIRRASRT